MPQSTLSIYYLVQPNSVQLMIPGTEINKNYTKPSIQDYCEEQSN
jgi:hypothetical protein